MLVKFKMKDGCAGCGLCYFQYPDYFKESNSGSASVNEGKLLDDNLQAKKIAAVCPNKIIEVVQAGANKKQEAIKIIEQLKKFSGCPVPTESMLRFDKNEYHIDIPYSRGGEYDYSSIRAAERAARDEFVSKMYSQIDNIILNIITQYRVKYVKPYYTKNINEGSVYAKTNSEVSILLKSLRNVIDDKLPSDFDTVEVFPDERSLDWKMLNKGELISDELISAVKNEFDYPADDYIAYIDTDSMERCVGTSWRGDLKTKEMYCYGNLREAFTELGKDILNACYYADESIMHQAVESTQYLVNDYNERLKKFLAEKIKLAEQAIK